MISTTRHPSPRLPTDEVPLTFSQRWTWTFVELDKLHTTRSVAVATRLCGPLDDAVLGKSLDELVRRHEALRTRIVTYNGRQWQEIDAPQRNSLQILELADRPQTERECEARRLAEQLIHEPLRISVGPLFAARLLRLGRQEHVLVIAMDHMISDGASIGIVMRDLWAIYAQLQRQPSLSLPSIPVQFADYAVWQHKTHHSWMQDHGSYWNGQLAGARRIDLIRSGAARVIRPIRVAVLPIRIEAGLATALRDLCQREKTTLPMGVLTAYIAAIAHWCDVSDVTVTLISTGRLQAQVRSTVGYFACAMYLRIVPGANDNFVDLLRRVGQVYTDACEHADSGRVAAQRPMPEFISNPRFNWIPAQFNVSPTGYLRNPGMNDAGLEEHRFETSQRNDFDAQGGGPELLLSESGGTIEGGIWYRSDLPGADADIEGFEICWRRMLQTLGTQPTGNALPPVSSTRRGTYLPGR
jgi:Condensation domain